MCGVLIFLYNLDIDAHNGSMAIFCPASWLSLYHLASTWLQLPPMAVPNTVDRENFAVKIILALKFSH